MGWATSALLTKRGGAQASLVAFDLLRRDGDDMRLWPIEARREALMRLLAGVDACSRMHAELGLEGIVSKRAGSLYRSGRSRDWLKAIRQDMTCLARRPDGPYRRERARGARPVAQSL
jgi:bifunctional non-homologous end joining protein LigD